MKYWFLVQKEYVTERLLERSYLDRYARESVKHCSLVKYSETLRCISDTTQNEEADYILVPLSSFFHDDLQGLVAYSEDELHTILEQSNWEHNS